MTNMDLMALLSTVVLVATIATTVFAVAAYAASRGYIGKKPRAKAASLMQSQPPPLPSKTTVKKNPAAQGRKSPILKRYNPFE